MSHVCLYQATWQNDFIKSSLCESTPSTTILLFHHALYTLLRNNNKHDPALVRGLPVYSWIIDIVFDGGLFMAGFWPPTFVTHQG